MTAASVITGVLMTLIHFVMAYAAAAAFSSHISANPLETEWGSPWTWFWLIALTVLFSGTF